MPLDKTVVDCRVIDKVSNDNLYSFKSLDSCNPSMSMKLDQPQLVTLFYFKDIGELFSKKYITSSIEGKYFLRLYMDCCEMLMDVFNDTYLKIETIKLGIVSSNNIISSINTHISLNIDKFVNIPNSIRASNEIKSSMLRGMIGTSEAMRNRSYGE